MLLDHLKNISTASAPYKARSGGGREIELIGKEQQGLTRFGILEANPAQMIRIVLATVEAIESESYGRNDSGATIGQRRIDAASVQIRLAACDEEGSRTVQNVEPFEIRYPRSMM